MNQENDNELDFYDEVDEPYDDEEPEDEEDQPHPPTFSSDMEDVPPVSDQELIDRWVNKNTKFRKYILNEIDNSNLFTDTKYGLRLFVNTYFNNTLFMTNLSPQKSSSWMESGFDPQRYARLLSQLLLLKNEVLYHPADQNNSELLIIVQSMKNHLELIIPMTIGEDRESILNREVRTRGEQILTNKERKVLKNHEKRKKIGGLF